MLKGFKEFVMRGNIIDLAVAVIIGGAFGAVVNALVRDLITPFIAAIGGKQDFSGIFFTVNGSKFMVGEFLNALTSFLIISAVIYFLVVTPMNKIMEKIKRGEKVDPTEKPCPECMSSIPIKAKRCKYCTSVVK
jgi:large conductance mechanosensitive channel